MHRIHALGLTLFLWFLFFCVQMTYGQTDATDYKIYDTAKHKEISFKKLTKRLSKQDVIFFGEEHNDSIAHLLELALFKAMAEERETALSLEMFQTDVQLVLDEYLNDLISAANLERDARPWNNYATDYKPLVSYAKEKHLSVIAANAPSRYTNRVSKKGLESLNELSEMAKNYLAPLPIDTLTGKYYENFAEIMGGHQFMGDMKIYQSQNLWDATMAYKIAQFRKDHPEYLVLHLNGRFHSDEKLGAYQQLLHYDPSVKVANISCFSGQTFDHPNWEDLQHLGDFIILTRPNVLK